MLGIFGAIIYGIAYAVGWSMDEQQEQHERKTSLEKGIDFYYDKRGNKRWASTGRKMTPQEILQEYKDRHQCWEEKKKEIENHYIKKLKELYDIDPNPYKKPTFEEHIFERSLYSSQIAQIQEVQNLISTIPKERQMEIIAENREKLNNFKERVR